MLKIFFPPKSFYPIMRRVLAERKLFLPKFIASIHSVTMTKTQEMVSNMKRVPIQKYLDILKEKLHDEYLLVDKLKKIRMIPLSR